jgi:hypothetical protein
MRSPDMPTHHGNGNETGSFSSGDQGWTASLVHEPEMQSLIITVKSIDPNVFTDLNVSTVR